jgi:hypothetical protein
MGGLNRRQKSLNCNSYCRNKSLSSAALRNVCLRCSSWKQLLVCLRILSMEVSNYRLINRYSIWLGTESIKTTRKMVLQLKWISHRLNFIVYHYMFRSSCDCHQAVYIINIIKLIEISIWIHIVVQHVNIIKTVKVVKYLCLMLWWKLKYRKILQYTRISI